MNNILDSLLDSAVRLVYQADVSLLILFSDSLLIAQGMSKYRPNCMIIAITNTVSEYNYLRTIRGVAPMIFDNEDISIEK